MLKGIQSKRMGRSVRDWIPQCPVMVLRASSLTVSVILLSCLEMEEDGGDSQCCILQNKPLAQDIDCCFVFLAIPQLKDRMSIYLLDRDSLNPMY